MKGTGCRSERIGEQRGKRQADHAAVVVQVVEASRRRAVPKPPRARRAADVVPLLPLDLQPSSGAGRWPRLPRVEGDENMIVLGGVPSREAVGQAKDVGAGLLLHVRVASEVAVVEVHVAHADARLHAARAPERELCQAPASTESSP